MKDPIAASDTGADYEWTYFTTLRNLWGAEKIICLRVLFCYKNTISIKFNSNVYETKIIHRF